MRGIGSNVTKTATESNNTQSGKPLLIRRKTMGTMPSYATIENKNGYVFHKTQKYCFTDLAVEAAKKAAKKKKIDVDGVDIKIIVHDAK